MKREQGDRPIDARRFVAVMREITLDAVRATIAATRETLRSELGLTPAQTAHLTARIMHEAVQRFTVNVAATIATLE